MDPPKAVFGPCKGLSAQSENFCSHWIKIGVQPMKSPHSEFFLILGIHYSCQLPGGGGGRLQPVLMRHPPQLSVKTWGGAVWEGVGGRVCGWGGGVGRAGVGGFPAREPLLPHAYLQGGCVSGGLGVRRYVCDNSLGKRGRTALEPGKSSECKIFTSQQTTFV